MNKDSQLMLIQGNMLTERDMMSAIDGVLEQLNQTGNINQAIKVLNTLDRVDNITGKAKSYLLWGTNEWWKKNKSTEDFADHVESTSSTKAVTVERYVNVWEQIEQERIPKKIQDRPMRELIPIANMLAQGYEPSKEQWQEIHLSANPSELLDAIRGVKGTQPRKSGMIITLEKDGSLYVNVNDKRTYIGFLVDDRRPDVLKAIERIIAGAQIIRR